MSSERLIDSIIFSVNFEPKPYSYAVFFLKRLQSDSFEFIEGWNNVPHYKLVRNNTIVTVSPYVNVVIIEVNNKEVYCQHGIPQNENEYSDFWVMENLQIPE